ncbi:MAG TPA: hypothetical protein VME01_05600 [Solirubrobacteraceae bacterium]|nr:hypothetical protein [Solirubrobacteraceae bacterium]
MATLDPTSNWRRYQFVAAPGRRATKVLLQIYTSNSEMDKVQYADVSAHPLNLTKSPVVVSYPTGGEHLHGYLLQTPDSASSLWSGPAGSVPVMIDGLRNGWISRKPSASVSYWPQTALVFAYIASCLGILALAGLVVAPRLKRESA